MKVSLIKSADFSRVCQKARSLHPLYRVWSIQQNRKESRNLQVEKEHDEIIKSEKRKIKRVYTENVCFIYIKNSGKGAIFSYS